MLFSLQQGMRQGDPRAVEVGVKVLIHKAEINGYKAPNRVEMTNDSRIKVDVERDSQTLANLDRLTLEELTEYRRLEAKASGVSEAIEVATVKTSESSAEPETLKPKSED
jgi:hypothetical protein